MKKIFIFLPVLFIVNLLWSSACIAADDPESSIVKIQTDKGVGTGFYVHNNILATNYHVIEGANRIFVIADKENVIEIEWVINYDEITDVALLFIPRMGQPLPIRLSNLAYGTELTSSGYPLGGERYTLKAIFTGWENFDNTLYLKLHAIIIPGMSGGPVLDRDGNVVALNRLGNYNPWSQQLVALSAKYIQQLLEQGLKKDFSQYIPLTTFAQKTKKTLRSEKKYDEIIITDN